MSLGVLPVNPSAANFAESIGLARVRVEELVASSQPCSPDCQNRAAVDTQNLELLIARVAYLEDEVKRARADKNLAQNDANMWRIAYAAMRDKAATIEAKCLQSQRLNLVQKAAIDRLQAMHHHQTVPPPTPAQPLPQLTFLPPARQMDNVRTKDD